MFLTNDQQQQKLNCYKKMSKKLINQIGKQQPIIQMMKMNISLKWLVSKVSPNT